MLNGATADGLANLLATIRQLYPQARVTGGLRDPNSPLGRANPRSLHMQGTADDPRAVDVAPIPGVSFDQYRNSISQAGVPISQAFDEQKHPFPWTTGPNWHLAQGQPVQHYYPQKPRTLGDVSNPIPDFRKGWEFNPVMNEQAPVGLDASPLPQMPPQALGDLPGGKIPGHKGLFPGKDWKAILGIIGDAMTAYGGGQPIYGPAMNQRHRDEQQQTFDREKWAAQLAAKNAEPPQFIQNLGAYLALPPETKRQYLGYLDATQPNTITTPQGPQNLPRTSTKVVNGKIYYNIGGEWYEEGE